MYAGRKDPQSNTWELFASDAMMEYLYNKEPLVARNVFDMGLKKFGTEIQFVLKYLGIMPHSSRSCFV